MAEWKCRNCGWTNAGSWTKCARCGLEPMSDEHLRLLSEYNSLIEEHRISSAPKWEYLQLSSEDLESVGGLAALGNQGWELVAVSTYSEGGTVLLIGPQIYRIRALYVFKRPRVLFPEQLQERPGQILEQLPAKVRAQLPPAQ